MKQTIDNILAHIDADTEIIVICDGYWPEPAIEDHPRVVIVHHESIGQRAATNEGARLSQAKYIMKIDAHCAVGDGFDSILMEDCEPDWTMVPMMWNLHAFDWKCMSCMNRTYQGARPTECQRCGSNEFEKVVLWKRRGNKVTVSWRFDDKMHFQYWRKHKRRPEAQGDLVETMSCIGACFFMERERFWDLGGMDEKHGSWGQFGTELACKAWLSGGKMITSKKTWFGHMFRTGNFKGSGYMGGSFPYPLSGKAQDWAKEYSQDLWLNDKWDKAVHPLSWLVERFKPVPDWHEGAK
ncbi:MAG: glycosyltransferase family 2 protein [Gammaproteobacteria bacterium]|nr:glycosyltransferase family 2 protein [Gammaproteobacteria bacterium]